MSYFDQLVALCKKYERFPRKEEQSTLVEYVSELIESGFSTLSDSEFETLSEVSPDVESTVRSIRGQVQVFNEVLEFCTENDRIPTPEDEIWSKFKSVWNRRRYSRSRQLDALRKISPQVKQQIRDYEKQLSASRKESQPNNTRAQFVKAKNQLKRATELLEQATRIFESLEIPNGYRKPEPVPVTTPVREPEPVPIPVREPEPEPEPTPEPEPEEEEPPKPKAKAKAKSRAKSRTKS